ncbi:hypothetical protein PSAB6_610012 [Paraburkholderia sabiae]|nr:hypothetical protein PSAB6_610012 [Paraburkholderia sabiae]
MDCLVTRRVTRECEVGDANPGALATGVKKCGAVWSAGPVGGPQANTRIGGVSGFLLPTFLCRCKEK